MPTVATEWTDTRNFALKAAMVTLLDGLDQYLKVLGRIRGLAAPQLDDLLAGRARDSRGRRYTIPQRFDALCQHYTGVGQPEQIALLHLLSAWRNHFVHGDYRFKLGSAERKVLLNGGSYFSAQQGGANIIDVLDRFDRRHAPELSDLATLITAAQLLVAAIDIHLLQLPNPEAYARALLEHVLKESPDPPALLERVFERGGVGSGGRVHSLFLANGGNHDAVRTASAPSITRARLNALFGVGRNAASAMFGIPRP
jgi:hypothetical protein